jgi:hypothetical protein
MPLQHFLKHIRRQSHPEFHDTFPVAGGAKMEAFPFWFIDIILAKILRGSEAMAAVQRGDVRKNNVQKRQER